MKCNDWLEQISSQLCLPLLSLLSSAGSLDFTILLNSFYRFTLEDSYCKPTCWSSCLWARECLGWAGRSQARGDERSDPSVWAASRKSSEEGAWSPVWRSPPAGLSPPSPIISQDLIYNTITTKHSSVFNAGIYSNISRLFLILHPFTGRGMWTGWSVTGYWTWPPPTIL